MEENKHIPPRSGQLLISEPFLQDENFVRSVILLCESNEKGSFGLVLNKLSILRIKDLLDELDFLDMEVYVGGPVEQNTLHFIYWGEPVVEGSIELAKDLYWGGNFEEFVAKYKAGHIDLENFRFFIGYSGWSSGQLESELAEKTWIICDDIDAESIFTSSPDDLWRVALRNMGGDFQVLANYPIDPRLN
ncbi:YqgE/AlgH family protein [Echinicola strongylocentroti]|uniref:YqgE/AlgH family protein n=1 Tax=Echinicola strongylocentroti TaxID=1795355 RepID=A0A2Z4ICY9_9BACT|nr:YqgE/AlgH family protein [Echinicola strongylocentroti]AWW28709.1 YqgE/AlgH family protein [Echinicola strongylocentroti]